MDDRVYQVIVADDEGLTITGPTPLGGGAVASPNLPPAPRPGRA